MKDPCWHQWDYMQEKSPSQEVFPPVSRGKAISGILRRKQINPLRGESTCTNILAVSFHVTASGLVTGSLLPASQGL